MRTAARFEALLVEYGIALNEYDVATANLSSTNTTRSTNVATDRLIVARENLERVRRVLLPALDRLARDVA
jgi:hypothetical protein